MLIEIVLTTTAILSLTLSVNKQLFYKRKLKEITSELRESKVALKRSNACRASIKSDHSAYRKERE